MAIRTKGDLEVIESTPALRRKDVRRATPHAAPVRVTGEGYDIDVQWDAVPGANDVVVDSADLRIGPSVVEEPLAEWPVVAVSSGGPAYDVTVPKGGRVRSLTLGDLKTGDTALADSAQLDGNGLRLAVTVSSAGGAFGAPLYTVPPVEARGVLPASFTGATYASNVLSLPDVAAEKIRLNLVKKGFPAEPDAQPMSLGKVHGVAVTLPRDLTVTDADGAVVWSLPGEMPGASPPAAIDLRHAVEKLLKPKVASGRLATVFKVTGSAGSASISFSGARGAVVRRQSGDITVELDGVAAPLAIPEPPLAAEVPSRVTADLTVKYKGLRLLEALADAVPERSGGIEGLVVTDTPVVRRLPPAALNGLTVAKIGIIGRAPVDCEIVLQLFDLGSGAPGAAVTRPASATLAPSNAITVTWLDIPKHDPIQVPVGVSARTNHGRFLWAAGPDPRLRLAVFDIDPGGAPVRIGGADALPVHAAEVRAPSIPVETRLFASTPPLVDSVLFATIDVSNLTLEYDR